MDYRETPHLTPPPHPLSLVFPLPRFIPTGSPCAQVVSQDFTSFHLNPPPLPFLFPLLFSPHPLSLCLVCLPSQLLSKKRGLFRIHAGRKQRYPRLRACARGTLKHHQNNNTTPTPSLMHTTCSPCLKHSIICWTGAAK